MRWPRGTAGSVLLLVAVLWVPHAIAAALRFRDRSVGVFPWAGSLLAFAVVVAVVVARAAHEPGARQDRPLRAGLSVSLLAAAGFALLALPVDAARLRYPNILPVTIAGNLLVPAALGVAVSLATAAWLGHARHGTRTR